MKTAEPAEQVLGAHHAGSAAELTSSVKSLLKMSGKGPWKENLCDRSHKMSPMRDASHFPVIISHNSTLKIKPYFPEIYLFVLFLF